MLMNSVVIWIFCNGLHSEYCV